MQKKNHGAFKFVLSKEKVLYIGFARSDYHMDICGNLDRFAIRSAGYLDYHDDLSDKTQLPEWIPNGSSEGYGIGIRPDDQEAIKAALISMSDIDVVDLMDDNARCKIQL